MKVRYKYDGSGYTKTELSHYEPDFLLELYHSMLRIRLIEERIESKYHEDEMKTPIHLVIGQEAVSVGACATMQRNDLIYCSHRTHGNYLAKGGDLKAMMSELYCRANGCAGSRGGSMHLLDKDAGVGGSSAIVAGIIPIATGAALAMQRQRTGQVVGVFFGDAGVEEGVFWESLNAAALWKLPILFLCENNFYSVSSPLENRQPAGVQIFEKAKSFGVDAVLVDGTNVLETYEATRKAMDKARSGKGPVFLEFRVYRWRGHGGAGDDTASGYRSAEEVTAWQAVCPVDGFRQRLCADGFMDDVLHERMVRAINAEIDEAFEHAATSPNPEPGELITFVYSE